LDITIGYAKIKYATDEEGTSGRRKLADRNWAVIEIRPYGQYDYIPPHAKVFAVSYVPNAPINELKLDFQNPAAFCVSLYDETGQYLSIGKVKVEPVPRYLFLNIYNETSSGRLVNHIVLNATGTIDRLEFQAWDYVDKNSSNPSHFRYSTISLESIPSKLLLEGTFPLRTEPLLNYTPDPSYGPAGRIIDSVMMKVASRLLYIGKTIRQLPESIVTAPSNKGYVYFDLPGGEVENLSLILTSYRSLSVPGDYIIFYNTTLPQDALQYRDMLIETAVSISIHRLYSFHGYFTDKTFVQIEFRNRSSLQQSVPDRLHLCVVDTKEQTNASVLIESLPEKLSVLVEGRSLKFSADRGIERIQFLGVSGENLILLNICDVPCEIDVSQSGDVSTVSTHGSFIGSIFFLISNSSREYPLLEGEFLLLYRNTTANITAGSVKGISHLSFSSGANSSLSLHQSGRMHNLTIMMYNSLDKEYTGSRLNKFDIRVLLFNIPQVLDMESLGGILDNPFTMPDVLSIARITEVAVLMKNLTKTLSGIVPTLTAAVSNITSRLGAGGNFVNLSFSSGSPLGIIASLRAGDEAVLLDDVLESPYNYSWNTSLNSTKLKDIAPIWTHGISLSRWAGELSHGDESTDEAKINLAGNIWLPLLAERANLIFRTSASEQSVNLSLSKFMPVRKWMILQTRGFFEKDVDLFISGLKTGGSLKLCGSLFSNLTYGKSVIIGNLSYTTYDSFNRLYSAGPLLVSMRTPVPMPTSVLVLIPTLPGEITASFSISAGIHLEFNASSDLPLAFVSMSRLIGGSWHDITLIAHEAGTFIDASMMPMGEFDVDEPSP
ncbi:MAG: hypothetical protein QW728_01275, partial [Thermoplasmata archaeon]